MIIGLTGLAGSGKSTVAKVLVEKHAFEEITCATPMKKFVAEMFDFSHEQLWGPSSMRNAVDPKYGFSPRQVLQELGTEWARKFYPDIWIDYALKDAVTRIHHIRCDGVVISDIRFGNEASAIKKAGGQIWKILRQGAGLQGVAGQHISENEYVPYDRILDNQGGSLEDLAKLVADAIGGR